VKGFFASAVLGRDTSCPRAVAQTKMAQHNAKAMVAHRFLPELTVLTPVADRF
jgi:hypothetical protein